MVIIYISLEIWVQEIVYERLFSTLGLIGEGELMQSGNQLIFKIRVGWDEIALEKCVTSNHKRNLYCGKGPTMLYVNMHQAVRNIAWLKWGKQL